jgi:hypothetical protein
MSLHHHITPSAPSQLQPQYVGEIDSKSGFGLGIAVDGAPSSLLKAMLLSSGAAGAGGGGGAQGRDNHRSERLLDQMKRNMVTGFEVWFEYQLGRVLDVKGQITSGVLSRKMMVGGGGGGKGGGDYDPQELLDQMEKEKTIAENPNPNFSKSQLWVYTRIVSFITASKKITLIYVDFGKVHDDKENYFH